MLKITASSGECGIKKLRRFIEVRAAELSPCQLLVVVQKKVEEVQLALGALPPNVSLAHFNDLTGMNNWSTVGGAVIVGRIEPPPAATEGMARALFGAEVAVVAGDANGRLLYPRVTRGLRMRDGSGVAVQNSQHPDERVEAVRRANAEAEAVQARTNERSIFVA